MGVNPKISGNFTPPKMDGENNGSKPYFLMDDLGGFTTPIFGNTLMEVWGKLQNLLAGGNSHIL